ncbi:MAG: hypothetical protein ACRD03_17645 [Acidimicrobiales bacterium]
MTDSPDCSPPGDATVTPRRSGAAQPALAAAVAIAVCAPFLGKGWLFLLDWIRGPHVPPPAELWGLGGPPAALPFALATWALGELVGPAVLGWLPIVAALATAVVAAGALVGGPVTRRAAAGLLYAVNPFVFDRAFAGHVAFLLGYALLPLAVRSLLRAEQSAGAARLWPVLWVTLLIGLAPHFAWLVGVICLAMLATRPSRRTAAWLAGMAAAVVLASAYLVVPSAGRPPAVEVGPADLAAYRTSGDGPFGPLANVAGLHGFWRQEIALPKHDVPGWPLFWAAVVVVAGAGVVRGWRGRNAERRLVAVVAGSGALGFLLALGDQGPAGAVFRWLFVNVPGFEVMREPQKFAALLALAYAALFGIGAQSLVDGARRPAGRRLWAAALLVLPVATAPTLLWGFGGRVEVGRYPASWAEADRLMGDGPEKILFLPWHQYLHLPFTRRIVANPARFAFRRDVVSGDNVELPGLPTTSRSVRSAYLEFLYGHGERLASFGQLVAPQGVRYVVVAKAVDWRRYFWLDRQDDLEKVLDREEIVVYRNTRPVAAGTRVPVVVTVEDWGEYAGLSERADLSGVAVRVRREGPGPIRAPATMPVIPPASVPISAARRSSPVRYEVAPGPPGWLVLAEPYDRSWRLGDAGATRLAGGVTGFETGPGGGDARFGHWSVVRASYGLSAATVALVALAGFVAPGTGRKPRGRVGEGPVAIGPSR